MTVMNNHTIIIETFGGPRYVSAVSKPFMGEMTLPILAKISLSRAVNLNKSLENSTFSADMFNVAEWINEKLLGYGGHLPGRSIVGYDNSEVIFTGKICDLPGSKMSEFIVKGDVFSMLRKEVLPRITAEEFPLAPAESLGKRGNIFLGTASDAAFDEPQGMLEAWKADNTKYYFAAWHPISTLLKVYNENGNDVTASCSILNYTDGYGYIKYNITSPPDQVLRFNAKGPTLSGTLIQNPATMIEYVVNNFAGFDIDGVSEAAAIFTARGNYNGNCIVISKGETTFENLLCDFAKSFGCFIFPTRLGKMKLKLIELDENPVTEIHPSYVGGFIPQRNIEDVFGNWTTKYLYHFGSGQFQEELKYKADNTLQKEKPAVERKFVVTEATATDVTEREAALQSETIVEYTFEVPRHIAKLIELCDTVRLLPHWKNFCEDARDVFILRENRTHKGFVKFEGIDLTEMSGRSI